MRFTGGFENVLLRIPGVSRSTLIVPGCVIVCSKRDSGGCDRGVRHNELSHCPADAPHPASPSPRLSPAVGRECTDHARRYEGRGETGSVTVSVTSSVFVKVWSGVVELGLPAALRVTATH